MLIVLSTFWLFIFLSGANDLLGLLYEDSSSFFNTLNKLLVLSIYFDLYEDILRNLTFYNHCPRANKYMSIKSLRCKSANYALVEGSRMAGFSTATLKKKLRTLFATAHISATQITAIIEHARTASVVQPES